MATPRDIDQIINMLEVAFQNFKTKDMTKEIYWQTLQDIPTDELKAAVLHCLTESGRAFAPSIGEIRGAVSELRSKSNNLPSAFEAWQEVITQIRENGGDFGEPVWSHALVEKAVRSMGWRELRMSENQIADRARFLQCYEGLLERATREDIMLPEVKGYITTNGGKFIAPSEQIKLLAERLSK